MERDSVDEVQRKQLVWFGHTCRMDEERIPNRVLQWTRCWMDDVNEAMRSRNLNEEDSQNRERWRLGAEKRRET